MSRQVATAAILGAGALILSGCGGSGDDVSTTVGPGSSTAQPLPTQPGPAPETTTTTVDPCPSAHVVPEGDDTPEGQLVNDLNRRYLGYNETDPTSPVGITLRMVGPDTYDDFSYFCGSDCHNGWPDCRVSTSLYNSKMLIMHDTRAVAVTMSRHAGIIYNQTSVERIMGKCIYMYDGATFGRVNHGCGCAAKKKGCGIPDSAYGNQDCEYDDRTKRTKPHDCHNNTDTSPDVDSCWCNTKGNRDHDTPAPEEMTTESQQCFYKGAGIYPPNGPMPNELHEFVKMRVWNQENPPTEQLSDGILRHKQEYWNELVIEGEELTDMLNVNPLHAVYAFVYTSGATDGKVKAQHMQWQVMQQYGGPEIPIIEMDASVDTACSGPFRQARDMPATTLATTTTTWDGHSCADAHDQCGGKGWMGPSCCKEGLVCKAQNDYYSDCNPSQDGVEV